MIKSEVLSVWLSVQRWQRDIDDEEMLIRVYRRFCSGIWHRGSNSFAGTLVGSYGNPAVKKAISKNRTPCAQEKMDRVVNRQHHDESMS